MSSSILFSTRTNQPLAANIASQLNFALGSAKISYFSDGEIKIQIYTKIRQQNIFILQSATGLPNDDFIELILLTEAIKQASIVTPINITAIIPYFYYSRQTSSAIAILKLLATAGINKIITIDLHTTKIQKLSPIPIYNLTTTNLFAADLIAKNLSNLLIISPDLGGATRAENFAKLLNSNNLIIINKNRTGSDSNITMRILDEVNSIKNKNCIIIDDIVDTANTICQAAKLLKDNGARTIMAYCTHAVLSEGSIDRIDNSVVDELVISNSIPISINTILSCNKIRQMCATSMLIKQLKTSSHFLLSD
jgi:ribose-phosphate pyrophosphokinase